MILWIIFAMLFLFICFWFGLWVGYAIPIIKFLNRYEAVIEFYKIFKKLDNKYLNNTLELTFEYKYGTYKCRITYSSVEEAKKNFSELIQDALNQYSEIDYKCISNDGSKNDLASKKAKLIYIRNEIYQL